MSNLLVITHAASYPPPIPKGGPGLARLGRQKGRTDTQAGRQIVAIDSGGGVGKKNGIKTNGEGEIYDAFAYRK